MEQKKEMSVEDLIAVSTLKILEERDDEDFRLLVLFLCDEPEEIRELEKLARSFGFEEVACRLALLNAHAPSLWS